MEILNLTCLYFCERINSTLQCRTNSKILNFVQPLFPCELQYQPLSARAYKRYKQYKACFKRRASHVPNVLQTIDNQLKCLIIYCFYILVFGTSATFETGLRNQRAREKRESEIQKALPPPSTRKSEFPPLRGHDSSGQPVLLKPSCMHGACGNNK